MRKLILIICVINLFLSPLFAYQADIQDICSDKYFETTINEIDSAKSSIEVVMYLISVFPDQPNSQSTQLVNALIKAKERGVNVKVILDQNIDFQEETREDMIYGNKNQQAYELLRRNSIPVFFDEADTYTHAKAIIIDNETVIFGSTNWSKAALTRNNEVNAVVRSKEFAANILNQVSQIKLQEVPASITPTVSLSKEFLTKENILGEMASQSDERAFDTYLYLLSEYSGNKDAKVTLNYDKLSNSLGIDQMPKEDYRRQINKVLTKLKEKYSLIDFENPARNQDAEIILKSLDSPKKLYVLPETNFFQIPTTFWKYHWNRTLSFPAKLMYLVNLSYTSDASPSWYMSRDTISERHHVSKSFISDGTKELRKENLLSIKYGDLESQNYSDRQANIYTPKPLYDPEDLKKELKHLEEKYGKDKLTIALESAAVVFEENNPKTIRALLELEDKYGKETILQATKQLQDKNPDNPKRSIGYLINTIKSIGDPSHSSGEARA